MGTRMLAITDGRPEHGAHVAAEFGERLFAMRGRAQKPPMAIEAALEQASQANATPIVIADTADNAGGGAPSDSTFVLQTVLERGLEDVALGPLWDPIAAAVAMDAGEGATLDLRVGGKMGPASGPPLDLRATVTGICRNAVQSYGVSHEPLGDCVAIRANGVAIVLNTLRTQAFGPELFTNVGIDPRSCRIVVVKSTHHFHAGFNPIAADILYVGGPGTLERDLARLPYRRITRPKWPFDQA
jgi:microcystin degradation protein MlrC